MFVVSVDFLKCEKCESCVDECHENALVMLDKIMFFSYDCCSFCESCFSVCEHEAISLVDVQ